MPLRDVSPLAEWARREDPRYSVWRTVAGWVALLDTDPWRSPSRPLPEMSDLPHYEIRTAEVKGSGGVEVLYRRTFEGEVVDLLWVGAVSA